MYVVSGEQMKSADNKAINELGILSLVLMERAALETVRIIENKFQNKSSCVILCGKGNNGGDGFAIARILFLKGFDVKIISFYSPALFSEDCKTNYRLAINLGIEIIDDLNIFEKIINTCDFVVDALFGFGFKGSLSGFELETVKTINESDCYVYSVDIPSGISANCAEVHSDAIRADETITFTAYKKSAFLFPSSEFYGNITVADIGIPKNYIEHEAKVIDDVIINRRKRNINKSSAGKILVIAGSKGMSGAAYLSSLAALRSGAGLVTLAIPKCISLPLEEKATEIILMPLDDFNGSFSYDATKKLNEIINNYDAVVFGPGIGRSDEITNLLISLLKTCRVPFIIDADGLYALKDCLNVLNDTVCEIIITPHSMEMARLLNEDVSYIENNRYDVCRNFSEKYAVCTILKGAYTIVCDKSGEMCVNTQTANPGMATAGSGDVLSGIVAAFAVKHNSLFSAGKSSVYIHGLAGDIAREKVGEESLIASDIIDNIGEAIKSVTV